jgi:ribosome-associated protein
MTRHGQRQRKFSALYPASVIFTTRPRNPWRLDFPMLQVTDTIAIPDSEITLGFVRADGPGGQHVNKTATAVQLRFDVRHSPSLPEGVRRRLERLAGRRLTGEGVLVLDARSSRSQKQNREEALERLKRLIAAAARPPRPRRPTRPSAAARRRRLENKRRRAGIKHQRRPVTGDD